MESLVDERKELMRNCVVATRQRRPAMPRRQKKWGRFMLLCEKVLKTYRKKRTNSNKTTTMATKADPSQFQPDKSSSSTDAIKDWCMKPDISSSESMTVIPGVGPATAAAFSKVNIQKTKLSLTVFFVLVLIRPTNLLYQFSHFLCATPLLSLSFRALLPGWHRHDCTIVGEIFVLCGR